MSNTKVAVIILADTDTHEGLGRAVNALEVVKELKEGRDDVQLIFDGAGTKWPGEFEKPESKAGPLFKAVKDRVTGVCSFCAGAFGAKSAVEACHLPFSGAYDGHPSFRKLVQDGYQVITF